jgi:hypothetical protein
MSKNGFEPLTEGFSILNSKPTELFRQTTSSLVEPTYPLIFIEKLNLWVY